MITVSPNSTISEFALVLILSPGVPDVFKMLAVILPLGAVKLPETTAEPVAVKLVTVLSAVGSSSTSQLAVLRSKLFARGEITLNTGSLPFKAISMAVLTGLLASWRCRRS